MADAPSIFLTWDPNTLPPPIEAGEISEFKRWTQYRFSHPSGGGTMTLNGDQHGSTATKITGTEEVKWSPPYYTGSVYMTEEELRAVPGAEEFFNALVVVMNEKLALQNAPPPPPDNPPPPPPLP